MRSKMFSKKLFSTSQLENNMVFQKISIVHVLRVSFNNRLAHRHIKKVKKILLRTTVAIFSTTMSINSSILERKVIIR